MKSNSIYLPGLNGLRAIAALAVLYSHVNLASQLFGLGIYPTSNFAGFGVTIFFSLSGFLITYLLIKEKKQYQTIHIKKFYIRRILRIWPLYFIFILLVFLVKPIEWSHYFWFTILMLPNLSFAFNLPMHMFGHFWSLGVEEQFYSFWPAIVKYSKKLNVVLIIFIISFLFLKVFLNLYFGSYSKIYTLFYVSRFDCMAIGGLGAWTMINYSASIKKYAHRWIEIICWGIIFLTAVNRFHILSIFDHNIISIVTVLIIFQQTLWDKKSINLENKMFDYLGSISFGIYVYHPLMIYLNSIWMKTLVVYEPFKMGLVHLVVLLSTLLVAHLSYFHFESKILKLRSKFTTIINNSSNGFRN